MKIVFSLLLLGSALSGQAQSIGSQDIEPMLQQMQASGKISAQQAEITREHMKTMKADDWKALEDKAVETIERHPAAAEKVRDGGLDALDPDDFGLKTP